MTTFASILLLLLGALFIRTGAARADASGDVIGTALGLTLIFVAWGLA
jgi:hypothetical protein